MTQPLRIFFGGSFNPVHNGHLQVAREVAERLSPESVTFVPCKPWPGKDTPQVSDTQRLEMLQLAVDDLTTGSHDGQPAYRIDTFELQADQISYTANSLQSLAQRFPNDHIAWLVGMDSWCHLSRWHQWQTLTDYGSLVVVNRPGQADPVAAEQSAWAQAKTVLPTEFCHPGSITFVQTTPCDVSSSGVRDKLRRGQSVQFLLPDSVRKYLEKHRLYR